MKEIFLLASKEKQDEFSNFIQDLKAHYQLKSFAEIQRNKSTVVVLGGDGTLNYLANLVGDDLEDIFVIYFPAGTANDFAKSIKILEGEPSLDKVKNIQVHSPWIDIPLMKCNDKFFINVATGGIPAEVTNSGTDIVKKAVGKVEYYISAIKELIAPETIDLEFTAKEFSKKIATYGFLISQGCYAGGGVKVTSNFTSNFKKTFNLVTMEADKLTECLGALMDLQKKEILQTNDCVISKNLENLMIESKRSIPLKLDGEEYEAKKLEFSKSKNKLNFYIY